MQRLVVACSIVLASAVISASADNASQKMIAAVNQKFNNAYNNKNINGVAELFTSDGVLVAADGKAYHGRSEIKAVYQSLEKMGLGDHFSATTEANPAGDSIYEYGVWSMSVPGKDGAKGKVSGSWSGVSVKDGGDWHFKLLFVSIPPPPPPAN